MNSSEYKSLIENRLSELISGDGLLKESMRYSLMAGGKRIRPILALEFARIVGGKLFSTLDVACAIEMIHTYSLIHDDLPCMDDDDLRRGKPTNHIVFGECTATLAGDALQPLAFETIMESSLFDASKVRCASILAKAAGCEGMVFGQILDMQGEGRILTENELTEINRHKTGDMIAASCMIGVASVTDDNDLIEAAGKVGYLVGLAFQIRDDVLDVISTDSELGKPVGSDAEEEKNTYMFLLGYEECQKKISALSSEAINILNSNFSDTAFIEELIKSLEKRNN